MSGRRGHDRFSVLRSPEGVLRVLREVVIQSATDSQIIAVSERPGVLGEVVAVKLAAQEPASLHAQVLESHPIVVDGNVKHQLRLHQISSSIPSDEQNGSASGGAVAE